MNEIVEVRWREFEELGEMKVRQNLATHVYGEDNQRMAREWLAHKDQVRASEASRLNEASSREQIDIARSAKNAAWTAAIAAAIAAICATIAITISWTKIS